MWRPIGWKLQTRFSNGFYNLRGKTKQKCVRLVEKRKVGGYLTVPEGACRKWLFVEAIFDCINKIMKVWLRPVQDVERSICKHRYAIKATLFADCNLLVTNQVKRGIVLRMRQCQTVLPTCERRNVLRMNQRWAVLCVQ